MRRLFICLLGIFFATSGFAQFSPIQVNVQRVAKKKDTGESVTGLGGGWVLVRPGDYSANMSLRITLRNTTVQPYTGLKVRWGIVKNRVAGFGHGGDTAYGAEETVDLKPMESKVIETAVVNASGKQFSDGDARGEKIRGHGVQVIQGDKVVTEEFMPATARKAFDKLQPPNGEATEPAPRAISANGKKRGKKE